MTEESFDFCVELLVLAVQLGGKVEPVGSAHFEADITYCLAEETVATYSSKEFDHET